MEEKDAVNPGEYRVILFVQGQQAKNRPSLEFLVH